MLNSDTDNKSSQSFRIPLEIVREDPKHEQHHQSSAPTYGGDLLLSVTYKRNIIQGNLYIRKSIFLNYQSYCREMNEKLLHDRLIKS